MLQARIGLAGVQYAQLVHKDTYLTATGLREVSFKTGHYCEIIFSLAFVFIRVRTCVCGALKCSQLSPPVKFKVIGSI